MGTMLFNFETALLLQVMQVLIRQFAYYNLDPGWSKTCLVWHERVCNEMKRIRLIRSNEIRRGNQREVEVGKEKNALDQVRVRFSHFRLFVYLCTIPHFRYFYLLRSVVRGFSKKIRQNWNFRREARAQRGRDNKRQKKLILSTNYGIILTSVIQRYNKE